MAKPKDCPDISTDSAERRLARNQSVLAKELGYSTQTITLWMKHPSAPTPRTDKRYDIGHWQAFASEFGSKGDPGSEGKRSAKQQLEIERLQEQVRKLQLENDEIEGKLISIDEATQVYNDMARGFADQLKGLNHRISQEMAGLDVAEASKRIKEECRTVLETLSLGEYCKKKAFWQTVSLGLLSPQMD